MIDGSVLQSAQRCFEKKGRVVVKMVVNMEGKNLKCEFVTLQCRGSLGLRSTTPELITAENLVVHSQDNPLSFPVFIS